MAIRNKIVFSILAVLVFAVAVYATGYANDKAAHSTLYTDEIRSKSSDAVVVNDKFSIKQNADIAGFGWEASKFYIGTATSYLTFKTSNIGIGTQDPQATLDVNGPVKVGKYATASRPACTASIVGAFIFDTTDDRPYICAAAGWKPLDSDADKDGFLVPKDTNDNNALVSDPDLIAGNIKSGVDIFGVVGTGGSSGGSNAFLKEKIIMGSDFQSVSCSVGADFCGAGKKVMYAGCGAGIAEIVTYWAVGEAFHNEKKYCTGEEYEDDSFIPPETFQDDCYFGFDHGALGILVGQMNGSTRIKCDRCKIPYNDKSDCEGCVTETIPIQTACSATTIQYSSKSADGDPTVAACLAICAEDTSTSPCTLDGKGTCGGSLISDIGFYGSCYPNCPQACAVICGFRPGAKSFLVFRDGDYNWCRCYTGSWIPDGSGSYEGGSCVD